MKYALILAAALTSSCAVAEPLCEMGDAKPVDAFEAVKAAFFAGDFERFAEIGTAHINGGPASLGGGVMQLSAAFPNGFESCQTIVQRVDVGGMVQEITTFNVAGQTRPIAVYMLGAPVRGDIQITDLTFDTTLRAVLDDLL